MHGPLRPLRTRVLRSLSRSTAPGRGELLWWDLTEIGLVALGFLLYFLVRGAVADRTGDALAHARAIVELEVALRVFIEPAVNNWTLDHELFRRLVNFVYFWLDFPLIVGVGLLLFWKQRHWYTVLRDALLASGGIALVIYWLYPVAPPRFLTEWGFVDTLEVYANLSYQAQSLQLFVNPFAAVPSLHVGWAALLLYAVVGATRHTAARAAGWGMAARAAAAGALLLQSMAVVATANHYLFDGVIGLLVGVAGLGVALALQRHAYPALHRRVSRWAEQGEPGEPGAAPEVAT